MPRRRGQALVEFALIFPIMLVLLLGTVEVGFYLLQVQLSQNGVAVLSDLAAASTNWKSRTNDEDRRTRCHAKPLQPDVAYPDGGDAPGDRILLTWHCHYDTLIAADIFPNGINYSVSAEAVIGGPNVTPSPAVTP